MSDNFVKTSGQKSALSPPLRNFTILDTENIENLYEKMADCGQKNVAFVNKFTSEVIELPKYCDNRSCNNPNCKNHRKYKFEKEHKAQINYLNENIKKPKAWVFTDGKLPLEKITKPYIRHRFRQLNNLCRIFSISAYNINLEIKLYPIKYSDRTCQKCKKFTPDCIQHCKDYGLGYVHFHVVSGGIANLKLVRQRWKKQIMYETAIAKEQLTKYVTKYASKTPHFATQVDMELYHLLVYKTQMHRFSINKKSLEMCVRESEFIPYSLLELEVYHTYKDSKINYPPGRHKKGKPPPFYSKFVEEFEHKNDITPEEEFGILRYDTRHFIDKDTTWYKPRIKKPTEEEIDAFYEDSNYD